MQIKKWASVQSRLYRGCGGLSPTTRDLTSAFYADLGALPEMGFAASASGHTSWRLQKSVEKVWIKTDAKDADRGAVCELITFKGRGHKPFFSK